MSHPDLQNKVVLITGASQGLGRHFSKVLAKAGCLVVATSLKSEMDKLESLVTEIKKAGGKAIAIELNVHDFSGFDTKISEITQQTRHIDILVNNAGISYYSKFFEISEKDWDIHLNTNLKGPFFLAQAVAKNMVQQKRPGVIVNIGSVAGNQAKKYALHFCVSKAGMHHLTRLMAFELLNHGIRVNTLSPGLFPSEHVTDFIDSEAGKLFVEQIPMKRPGKYQELDGALLLLASEASSYMTGSMIEVDGGFAIDAFLHEDYEDSTDKANGFFKKL